MKLAGIFAAFAVPSIFVIGTFFLRAPEVASETSQWQPRAEASVSIETAANLDTVSPLTSPAPVNSPPVEPIIKSKARDKIESIGRRLTNNVWGAPENENLTSGVFLIPDGSFGWYWDRPQPKLKTGATCVKPIYPNVRCGGSPWDPSNSAYFPIKLGSVESLKFNVRYNYPAAPTGAYNLAYDIFLSDTDQHRPNPIPKPKAEVMIWLHATFPQPSGTYRGDFNDGNNTYRLYSFVMSDGRLYYSFDMKEPTPLQAQHTVDAGRLIRNLNLDPSWYIHGVEFGNEVVGGSGKIEISKFNVDLNGREL